MLTVTESLANTLFAWSNVMLIAGAAAVLIGTIGAIAMGTAREQFANERISANERATGEANAQAGAAYADAGKANEAAGRANERAAGLEKAAADARERTATLEKDAAGLRLELEKVRAPLVDRRLTPEQVNELVRALSGKKILLSILAAPSPDREINAFANDLIAAFDKAGLPFNSILLAGTMRDSGINAVPDGLNVSGDGEPKSMVEAAFRAAHIPFGNEPMSGRLIYAPQAVFVTVGFRPGLRDRN